MNESGVRQRLQLIHNKMKNYSTPKMQRNENYAQQPPQKVVFILLKSQLISWGRNLFECNELTCLMNLLRLNRGSTLNVQTFARTRIEELYWKYSSRTYFGCLYEQTLTISKYKQIFINLTSCILMRQHQVENCWNLAGLYGLLNMGWH